MGFDNGWMMGFDNGWMMIFVNVEELRQLGP